MSGNGIGRFVWHDLFTPDRASSMSFYENVAGWNYLTEHATDFAWGAGAKDFVLACAGDEAGAGFAETPKGHKAGWIPYVEVSDIDATAALAERLGAEVLRSPFDVAGVGRNALLRDPHGARIGLSQSRHGFPVPQRQFGTELYVAGAAEFPAKFYAELLEWELSPLDRELAVSVVTAPSGQVVAFQVVADIRSHPRGIWLPGIRVGMLDASIGIAEKLGGTVVERLSDLPDEQSGAILRDPNGAALALSGRAR